MNDRTQRAAARLQDRLLQLLGNAPEKRAPVVAAMLRRDENEATSYWLQLVVAIGIATLGLVVGSTAVIIGAMLIAPLMGPIVGLAMGLAAGSPFLVLRSAGRIAMSVALAIGGAAVITHLIPFHELTAQISARTSPTVLDLATATFCALAGVYATLRPGSDTAATAAGTSIGISLVPPLCASGFGLGVRTWSVASGAALLFLTNLVAIVVVGTMAFVAAGFGRVDVIALEREELARGTQAPVSRALAKRLGRLFESRGGSLFRFLMPFALLAAVYVPLRRGLDEVAWEVRARTAVTAAIASETAQVIQSHVRIERHEIDVLVVLLGSVNDAAGARTRMERSIRAASHVAPHLEVFAVPDAKAFAGLESTLLTPHSVSSAAASAPPPSSSEQLDAARARVRNAVDAVWPTTAAGEILGVDVGASEGGPLRLRVVHLGAPLGESGLETLHRALGANLGADVEVVDVAVPTQALTREDGDAALVAAVAMGARATAGIAGVHVCVVRPARSEKDSDKRDPDAMLARALDEIFAIHPRVMVVGMGAWSVRFVAGDCEASPIDGGASDAATDAPADGGSPADAATDARFPAENADASNEAPTDAGPPAEDAGVEPRRR